MSTVRKVPLRKCIGCNEMKNKKEMIRILKTPEGNLLWTRPDAKTGAAHTSVVYGLLQKGSEGQGTGRSFKMAIPKEVYETLEKEMEQLG